MLLLKSKIFTRGVSSLYSPLTTVSSTIAPLPSHQITRSYARARPSREPSAAPSSTSTDTSSSDDLPSPPPVPRYRPPPLPATPPATNSTQPTTIAMGPREYIHVHDSSTNISRVEVGPKNFVRKENERVIEGPVKMVNVLPGHYAKILNPVKQTKEGKIVFDEYGQAEIREGITEYRLEQRPFPLYPGETLVEIRPLSVVEPNSALKLFVTQTHDTYDPISGEPVTRNVGQEWLFKGPGIYKPRSEEEIKEVVRASVIKAHQALRLRAKRTIYDDSGDILHHPGEEWLMREQGAYIPGVDEEVVEIRTAIAIPDNKALRMRAKSAFTDIYGKEHILGEDYLITPSTTNSHIVDVNEELVGWSDLVTLQENHYCVITNPVDPKTGKNLLGKRKLVVGESFFKLPGEQHSDVKKAYVLTENDALKVKAQENFDEEKGIKRQSGDEWLIFGPREYIPPLQVDVVEVRHKVVLPENRAVYIIDNTTGQIRTQVGAFFLKVHENFWEKKPDPRVEAILAKSGNKSSKMTKSEERYMQITHVVPQGEAVQIYDNFTGVFRVVVGPDIAKLGPSEEFIIADQELTASSLTRPLGPQRIDVSVPVETLDHTKLTVEYSVTWQFDVDKNSPQEELAKIFRENSVSNYITDIIGAKSRQAVSEVTFPHFNANWSKILNESMLGDKVYRDPSSKLVLSNLNVVSAEPLDSKTKALVDEAVQRTVILTTEASLKTAKHAAELTTEQEKLKAEAAIEAHRAVNEITRERERNTFWELKSKNAKMESEVVMAQAQVQAAANIFEARETALAEADKFSRMVNAIGKDTLKAIAQSSASGEMMKGLGLKGFLLTDGKTPINLIDTAQRMFSDITQNNSLVTTKQEELD